MKKQGFTLVELLAVIIVIGLIALITTPVISNTIEKSRKEAAELGMNSIKEAADLYYYNQRLMSGKKATQFKCSYGTCSNGSDILELDGVAPNDGIITIDKYGNVSLDSIVIDKYLCIEKDQGFSCSKTSGKVSNSSNTTLTLENAKESTLTNYKIYGNSVQTTYTGKNLMNTSNAILNGGTKTTIENGFKLVPTDKTGGNTTSNNYGRFIHNNNANKNLYLEAGTYTISYNVKILEYSNAGESSTTTSHLIYTSDSATEVGSAIPAISFNFNKGKVIYTFTLDSPKWVTYALRLNGMTIEITNMQLEKGSSATSYEPYVGGKAAPNPDYPQEIYSVGDLVTDENNINYGKYEILIKVTGQTSEESKTYKIYLDEPLRCVNNVCDYIDFKNSNVVRNIKELNVSNLTWYVSGTNADKGETPLYYCRPPESEKPIGNINPYLPLSNVIGSASSVNTNDKNIGIAIYNQKYIRVRPDLTVYDTLAKWQEFVSKNTVLVYYALETPPEPTKINLPNIKLFDGTNNISIETNIKPSNIEIEYYN